MISNYNIEKWKFNVWGHFWQDAHFVWMKNLKICGLINSAFHVIHIKAFW